MNETLSDARHKQTRALSKASRYQRLLRAAEEKAAAATAEVERLEAEAKRDPIEYEWCVESTDEHGDIQDLDFAKRLDSLMPLEALDGCKPVLVLRRAADCDFEYAYVNNETGELPLTFGSEDNGYAIPVRFRRELKKANEE